MLENIDNLIMVMEAQNATELRLDRGQPARLVSDNGEMDLTQHALSHQEIAGALGPIVPHDVRRQFASEPNVEFDYECYGVGTVKVGISRTSGGASVVIRRTVKHTPSPRTSSGRLEAQVAEAQRGSFATAPLAAHTSGSGQLTDASAYLDPNPPMSGPLVRPAAAPPTTSQPLPPPSAAPAPPPAARVDVRAQGIEALFHAMFHAGASDLHLSVSAPPMIRKDGRVMPLDAGAAALTHSDIERLVNPIAPDRNREEFARRHDSDFAHEVPGLARFRVNVFSDRKGMGAVFRVIPSEILTAETLGLSPHILKLCHLTKGLVLVTGPTGSGKSTTLCAMIDYINRTRNDHIITIEDPIEFVHENKQCLINQREVHVHTDSFKDALRAALREDPDIILVGELRDLETIAIAIETAETGHLVFGTLHTTTAASTVDRVIDQFPADRQAQIRVMLAESLKGVIAQTLCRKQGGGRVAALEVLMVNSAIGNLIREGKTFQIPSMMQTGRGQGMVSLNDALFEHVKSGAVEPEEAYLKAVDKTGFETLLKRSNIDAGFTKAVS